MESSKGVLLVSLFIGVLAFQPYAGDKLVRQLSYDHITLSTVSGTVAFNNCVLENDAGRPAVPVEFLTLILPPNVAIATVRVAIQDAEVRTVGGTHTVAPGSPSIGGGVAGWPEGADIVDGRDMNVYNANAWYPASRCELVSVGTLGDVVLARIKVFPVQYNPVTRALRALNRANLVVSWELSASNAAAGISRSGAPYISRLKRITDNFPDLDALYGRRLTKSAGSAPGYVIITTSAIASGLTKLDAFVASKEARGFDVRVVDENTWGGRSCHDLRNWLKSNYEDLSIRYVLLIGNPHPSNGDVPMLMTGVDVPTDFYFAELTSNWDINNNGTYGDMTDINTTGGIDQDCEVSVGRISCYSRNYTDVDRILDKIIRYESESRESARSWRFNILFASVLISESILGYGALEAVKDDFCVPRNWEYYRIYDREYDVDPEQTPCSITAVANQWKSAPYGAFFWSTHGMQTSASSIMNTTTAATMPSDHPSIVYEGSCLNAHPETSGNLAYTNLKNGALSALASARISWANNDPKGRNADNEKIAYRYGKGVIGDSLPCGDAVNYFRSYLNVKSTGGNWFWQNINNFCLLGDPSVGTHTWAGATNVDKPMTAGSPQVSLSCVNGSAIRFTVPRLQGTAQTLVRINLYTVHGKPIQVLVNGKMKAGSRATVRVRNDLVPGFYLCAMQAGQSRQVIRIVRR